MKSIFKTSIAAALGACVLLSGTQVRAEEATADDTTVYTYEEAYEMALTNLLDISSIDNDLKQTEAQKQVLQKKINDINTYISRENKNTKEYRELISDLEDDIDLMDEEAVDTFYGNSDDPYTESADLRAQRDAMQQRLDGINALVNSKDDSEFAKKELNKNIDILNKQVEQMTLNQEVLRTSVEYSLRDILVNIRGLELDAELMEVNILLGEENLRRVELKNQLGQASDNDLNNAEYALTQSKASLETIRTAQENERKKLNTLLHLPLSQKIAVEYSLETEELPESTEQYIADKLTNDPGIKLKEINAEIKKLDYELKLSISDNRREVYNRDNKDFQNAEDRRRDDKELEEDTPGYEEKPDDNQQFLNLNQVKWESDQAGYDRDNAKLAMDAAARELEDARLNMESALHSQLNALTQLSLKEETVLSEIANAEEQLALVQVRFDTGMATQYELDTIEYDIQKLNMDRDKNESSQWLQQFLFFNPVLITE